MLAFGYAASLVLTLSTGSASLQAPGGVLAGIITDSASGTTVAQAQVRLDGTAFQATTDLTGRFAIRSVPAGRYTLSVRRVGYSPLLGRAVDVVAGETTHVMVALQPAAFRLADLTVTPGSFSFLDTGPASRQSITRAEIEAAPFGEDLFRSVTRLPGLASGDYGAHFSIRGGRQDETLILLDGLEIYEPFHLKDFDGGALSIIDVDAIDGVELLTGGFPAHYGDKRSGVMNITSRTPPNDGTHLTFGASFSNAHALALGTFNDRKGSWLVSGRRGFIDLVLRIIDKKETKAPSYEDLFGTVRYQVLPNHQLALSVLHAGDRYQFSIKGTTGFNDTIPTRENADNRYGNSYVWLTLSSLLGPNLSVRTLASAGTVTASRLGDETQTNLPIELYGVNGRRDFSLYGLKQDYRWQPSNQMILDWGFDLRSLDATFDWTNRVTRNPDDPTPDTTGFYPRITTRAKKTSGRTFAGYLSTRLQPVGPLTLELGLRYDDASYTGDRDWSPRVNALFQVAERTSLRAGWGRYRQRQGIADENAFDRLNRYFLSEQSLLWTVGLEHRFPTGGSFRAEAYTKRGTRLRPILRNWKSGLNVFPESAEDRILVYPDSSTSQGIELYYEGNISRRLTMRTGYSLALVDEYVGRIDHVNDPLKPAFNPAHPSPLDQRHAANVDLQHRLGRNWSVTGAYTFHSGRPFTDEFGVMVTRRNGTTDLAVRPDTLYGARLPAYHRLDVRFTRRVESRRGEFRFFFELINLTNHTNVLGYDVFRVKDPNGTFRLQRDPETWFSILPSLGVSWSKRL